MNAGGVSPDVSPLIPGLPDDISFQCLARLPLSSHLLLSHVSRSWRSFLRSPLIFTLRSDLNFIEPFLLLGLEPHGASSVHSFWFVFYPTSHRILPLPPPPLVTIVGSSIAVHGTSLYLLGGLGNPSNAVQIFDARLRRWAIGPTMSASHEFFAAAALLGRIYAVSGCRPESDSWAECLDPTRGTWAPVPSPPDVRQIWFSSGTVLSGKLLAKGGMGVMAFDPTAETWGLVSETLDRVWSGTSVELEGILYTWFMGDKLHGYDLVADEVRGVEGLEKGLPEFQIAPLMAAIGGLLWLVWEGSWTEDAEEMEICFAGIEISKMGGGKLKGEIVEVDSIWFTLPEDAMIKHCVAMEL